jgi:peptidoglycan/xylan/chitin deacetylase (PgdA/CDA1 family)
MSTDLRGFLKQTARGAGRSQAFARLVDGLERTDPERPNLLRVLTYHRVDRPGLETGRYPRLMVSPEVFEAQMRFVAARFQVLSMPELLAATRNRDILPPRSLLLTFDDAYADFASHAWPVLRRHGLPATLFVPTAFPGDPTRVFWWDRLYHALLTSSRGNAVESPIGRLPLGTCAMREAAFTRLREHVKRRPHAEAVAWVEMFSSELGVSPPPPDVLGWDDLRRLAAEGVTLGCHTRTHALANRISADELRDEAVGSRHDLEREIGSALPIFAYPSGAFDEQAVARLAGEGFELAFTTRRGIEEWATADRLRLRRIHVGAHTSMPLLRLQLLSRAVHWNQIQAGWNRLRRR